MRRPTWRPLDGANRNPIFFGRPQHCRTMAIAPFVRQFRLFIDKTMGSTRSPGHGASGLARAGFLDVDSFSAP